MCLVFSRLDSDSDFPSPDTVKTVMLTCIYMHNFLRSNASARNAYSPPPTFDAEETENGRFAPGTWTRETGEEGFFFSSFKISPEYKTTLHRTLETNLWNISFLQKDQSLGKQKIKQAIHP